LDNETVTNNTSTPHQPITLESRLRRTITATWQHISWRKVGLFIISLFLFLLSLTLMKKGAQGLAPLLNGRFAITNPANGIGFGWLFAYIIMSGSPVAAAGLTFFDAGLINQLESFAMITGSRLGASFIVIIIGFIYVLRGRDRATSLSIGLLSLTVSTTIHIGTFIIGIVLLQTNILQSIPTPDGLFVNAIVDLIFEPIAAFLLTFIPLWGLFLVGLGIILVSFNLFDKCLPQMALKESQLGYVSRLVYRPLVMFILGALLTLISMSVSVSLSILVPLSQRGFVRRENVIPYIMGANVTTFIDTLLAAVLLNNQAAVTIVLAQMVGVTLVSLAVMVTIFHRYEHALLAFNSWITSSNRNLAFFMVIIIALPIILLVIKR